MGLSKSFFLFLAATLLEYSTKDLTYLKWGMKNLIEGKHTNPLWLLTSSLNSCHQSFWWNAPKKAILSALIFFFFSFSLFSRLIESIYHAQLVPILLRNPSFCVPLHDLHIVWHVWKHPAGTGMWSGARDLFMISKQDNPISSPPVLHQKISLLSFS